MSLGSHKEAEEFEHLSPDVAKERLRTLATKMDRNMDGKIDKKELQVRPNMRRKSSRSTT